jgi:hypothetical protein
MSMQATFRLNEKNCFKARRRDKLNKHGGKKSFSGKKQKKIKSNKPILLEQGGGGHDFLGSLGTRNSIHNLGMGPIR